MKRTIISLALAFVAVTALAQQKDWAVTNFSVCYLRLSPDYESALETQELMGVPVKVGQKSRYWRQIEAPQPYTAWTTDMGLVMMTEDQKDAYIAAPKYIVTAIDSHVYSEPDRNSTPLCDLVMGDLVRKGITRTSLRPIRAFRGENFIEVMLPDGRIGFAPYQDVEDFTEWADSRSDSFENLRETAMRFVGVPYLWGGMCPKGFDCSGFVKFVYFMNGVYLKRNASQIMNTGESVELPGPEFPMEERLRGLLPGDLLFFGSPATAERPRSVSHVGLYLGEGMMIHSSQVVRINCLLPGREDSYSNSLVGATRIIGQADKGTGVLSVRNHPAYFPTTNDR